ncbi:hypothetical protein C1646_810074 [Rhizophagus diaphanus]|nr:hypothetical protein C1646_810074 [Rhizophagus diaphanus] [Rhizophagus sp. MUCL 43196]
MDSFIKSVKELINLYDCNCGNEYTQLSEHIYYRAGKALEWIPYDRLYQTHLYGANWIDGCIYKWDSNNQNCKREDQNMFVILKNLNNPASITSKYIDKIALSHKVYGITQNPETKNYIVDLKYMCIKCNKVCNPRHFQQNFKNWTSVYDNELLKTDTYVRS